MAERTLREAGVELGLSPQTLKVQVQRGQLRARLVGKTYVVSDREIARYRAEHLGRPGRKPKG